LAPGEQCHCHSKAFTQAIYISPNALIIHMPPSYLETRQVHSSFFKRALCLEGGVSSSGGKCHVGLSSFAG
jgi:hypothetical protein